MNFELKLSEPLMPIEGLRGKKAIMAADCIVANIIANGYARYSSCKDAFYAGEPFGLKATKKAIDALSPYIKVTVGYKDWLRMKSYATEATANGDAFLYKFTGYYPISPPTPSVIVKGGSSGVDVSELEAEMDSINSFISEADIFPAHTNKSLCRIFLNDSLEDGGRMYRAWWVDVKSEKRLDIMVDGENVVELDYKAMTPRMLYHMEGFEAPNDPYELSGLEHLEREERKQLVNTLLNGSGRQALNAALREKGLDCEYRRGMEEQLSPISDYFYKNKATWLQYLDSNIAIDIINKLKAKGITCLPIHDSFLVKESCEGELLEAMVECYTYGSPIITREALGEEKVVCYG